MYNWEAVVQDMLDRNILCFSQCGGHILSILSEFCCFTDKLLPELVMSTNKMDLEYTDVPKYLITDKDKMEICIIADKLGAAIPTKDLSSICKFTEYKGDIVIVKNSKGYIFGVNISE